MKGVLLLCLLPLVYGGAILGQEKCVWGPSYWCSHVSHARECGATKHCLQTVWKNQIIKPQSTATCTYCELIVNEFRDALKDKTTEDKIADILANVCTILPGTDTRDMCKGIVSEYAPELLQMFVNEISTDMICATLGLCSGLEDRVSPYGVQASNGTSDCQDCMKFFKDVQESITSQETIDQLLQLINQTVCVELGSFDSECVDLVKQFLPDALQFLAGQIDPDIVCRIFGFCTAKGDSIDVLKIKNIFEGRKSTGPLVYKSDEECDLCKDLFNQITAALRDKVNQDKVIAEAKKVVCDELGSLADQCKELVDQYFPMLFELLVNELDPTTICEQVGFCPTPGPSKVVAAPEPKPASMVGPGYVRGSAECTVCKLLMQQLDDYLKENGTIQKVEDLIDKVCDRLPSDDLKTQCLAFVKEYGPMVVKLTAQELDPKTFCTLLKLCTNEMTDKQKADAKCSLCEEIVGAVQLALKNVSDTELMNEAKLVCEFLPTSYKTKCLQYVSQYGPLVVSLLKEDPHSICQMAQMCTSSRQWYMTKPIPEQLPTAAVSGPSTECEICGTIILAVKSLLSNNVSKEEVKAALEKVCDILPKSYQAVCEGFIETYGDKLINLLVADLDATVICRALGLCPKNQLSKTMSAIMSPYDTLPLVIPEERKGDMGSSVTCEVCTTVLNYVENQLQQNATEQEIEDLLKKACAELKAYEAQCDDLIHTYLPVIINYITLAKTPQQICTLIGLCSATQTKVLPEPVQVKVLAADSDGIEVNSLQCDACKAVMTFVDKNLEKNASEAQIKAVLEKVCSYMPDTLQTECEAFINQYAPQIIDLLVKQLDPKEICSKLGLCSQIHEETVQVTDTVTCEVCQYAMTYLDQFLQGNKTEAAVKQALDNLCSYLPSSLSGECTSLVNQYSDAIINLIVNELADPSQICAELGLCSQTGSKLKQDGIEVNSLECDACKAVMTFVDNNLEKNASEAQIKAVLEKVCSYMPDTLQTECEAFINQYAPQIIDLLVKQLDPKEICSKLGLCSQVHEETVQVTAPVTCEVCQIALNYLDSVLKGNESEAEIQALLDKACTYFPDTLQTECQEFVNQYAPEIINLLIQEIDPKEICSKIGLCAQTQKPVTGPVTCEICKLVMKELESILKGDKTEEAIKKALDEVCSKLPDVSKQCEQFVNEYTDLLVNLLTTLPPSEVCGALKLCSTNDHFGAIVKILPEAGPMVCDVCQLLVTQIQEFLKKNRTEKELEDFLDRVCSILPDTVTAQCDELMKNKLDQILDLLEHNFTPKQVCIRINVCAPAPKAEDNKKDDTLYFKPQHRLVGQNKCTFGPSYWCASKENAAECNAFEHCMNHVWN